MEQSLTPYADVAQAEVAATSAYLATAIASYRAKLARNTLTAHDRDLGLWSSYLAAVGVGSGLDWLDVLSWRDVGAGLVAGYAAWMAGEGYAVSSINRARATIQAYCRIAAKVGVLPSSAWGAIRAIDGISQRAGQRLDTTRPARRRSHKKTAPNVLSRAQVGQLAAACAESHAGLRDRVIVRVLADHGLRCGELAGLTWAGIDLVAGEMTFVRPKVSKTQVHRLTRDAWAALSAWAAVVAGHQGAHLGPVLWRVNKGDRLVAAGMSEITIADRVRLLGVAIGVETLSPHDLRHSFATSAARAGTSPIALRDAGGWSSMATVSRYVESAAIANDGVSLD